MATATSTPRKIIPPSTTAAVPLAKHVPLSHGHLMWLRFRRHRLALVSLVLLIPLYVSTLFVEFLAPSPPELTHSAYVYAPPQALMLFEHDAAGQPRFAPHVYDYRSTVDTEQMRRIFTLDETQPIPVGLFVHGEAYRLFGFIESDIHLFGPLDPTQPVYLLGADRLGRDVFSRVLYGARVSLSIGLIGVGLSLVIGIILGGISGYYGGWIDNLIQRVIEFTRSLPTIPLWLGIAAALPLSWSPIQVYFVISIILSLVGWTGLARIVRGRFLSIRREDYIVAAHAIGCPPARIIFRHMLPSMYSHLIAAVTLAIPNMILAETALSFLGLGLRPPVLSWGVLLQDAQSLRVISSAPWMLSPALAIIITILALNFVGDGIRDAADPYR
ncbi:MAG: ABC transporter permease [Burkholderiales bacterium]|nr:ABC transporter permease [Anaerolineae bacterium]